MYKGIAASKGIGIGRAVVIKEAVPTAQIENRIVDESQVENEMIRFKDAVQATADGLEKTKAKASELLSEEEIQVFEAYKMVLGDPIFNDIVAEKIKKEKFSAESAVSFAIDKIRAMFLAIDNEYMRQRAEDIDNVGKSIMNSLLGIETVDLSDLGEDSIIVAKDLAPGETVTLDKKHAKGFAMEKGGATSHTAIIARTLEIPAVVGCGTDIMEIADGDILIIDGEEGTIIQNPSEDVLESYKEKLKAYLEKVNKINKLKDAPAETTDGRHVELAGNIAKPQDATEVLLKGGEAVGLFRTEFLYMDKDALPSEDFQFEAYKKVAETMGERTCIIRTMDIGGDKKLPCLNIPEEENPFLGYRAIRICLNDTEMFKTQLRALLRAAVYGNIEIMFPMISGVAEFRAAKALVEEAKTELASRGVPYKEDIKVGVMIEIPSAAVCADILAKEVDFFSIGTNDLCQYTLAVDRMNERISSLYDPLNLGVLRLIKKVIDAAHEKGIRAGMCGEMASSAEYAILLLGLGLDEFSMVPASIPHVKNVIRSFSYEEAKKIAEKAMEMDNSDDIIKLLKRELSAHAN